MLHVTREGEQLELHGSMLEIVRPVLELLWVSWALDSDGNNSFFNPVTWAIQALHCPSHSQVYSTNQL